MLSKKTVTAKRYLFFNLSRNGLLQLHCTAFLLSTAYMRSQLYRIIYYHYSSSHREEYCCYELTGGNKFFTGSQWIC